MPGRSPPLSVPWRYRGTALGSANLLHAFHSRSFHDPKKPRRRWRAQWKGLVQTQLPYPSLQPLWHRLPITLVGDERAGSSSTGWIPATVLRVHSAIPSCPAVQMNRQGAKSLSRRPHCTAVTAECPRQPGASEPVYFLRALTRYASRTAHFTHVQGTVGGFQCIS